MSKIMTIDDLSKIRENLRADGRIVVLTNGCFDMLHVGHTRYLCQARALGDCLIVGLNGDASVRRLKGEKRPLVPEGERAEMLEALTCVDYVVIFEQTTAEQLVTKLRPDIYAKGGDYKTEADAINEPIDASHRAAKSEHDESRSGKYLPEASVVASYGGKVVILPLQPGRSTTGLVDTILERYGKSREIRQKPRERR